MLGELCDVDKVQLYIQRKMCSAGPQSCEMSEMASKGMNVRWVDRELNRISILTLGIKHRSAGQ